MPLDQYSPCPCGTGKKVKFCCPDLLAELNKVERMIEGDQRIACLDFVNGLLAKHPDRACLLAAKTAVLGELGRTEEVGQTVEHFLAKHPQNTVALAESALVLAAEKGLPAAIERLQEALEVCDRSMPQQLFATIGTLARVLASSGYPLAARGHLMLQLAIQPGDEQIVSFVVQLNASRSIPLLLKEPPRFEPCPEGVAWQVQFEEALEHASRGLWRRAAQILTDLTSQASDVPALWYNLAVLRCWLIDHAGAVEALRRYVSFDLPLDDRVEAEALAQVLDESTPDLTIDILAIEYPIADQERVLALLTADPQAVQMPTPQAAGDDEPPPRAVFLLLDRPDVATGAQIKLADIPRAVGHVSVFGKQTDRAARLELVAHRNGAYESTRQALERIVGDAAGPAVQEETLDQLSAIQDALNANWKLPEDTPADHRHTLVVEHRQKVLLERWPQLPNPVLDGKTPEQAAGDPAYRIRLLALVLLLELANDSQGSGSVDFNQLRQRLGLPVAEPISPVDLNLDRVPLARLARIEVGQIDDDRLVRVYLRAAGVRANRALRNLALEVVARPTLADKIDQAEAYGILADLAEDTRDTLKYIDLARQTAVKQGQSSATWDLAELSVRVARGEGDEFTRLMNHLTTEHLNEPGVRQSLLQLLSSMGLIGPDGRPVGIPSTAGPPSSTTPAAQPEAGEIWTPSGEAAASGKSGLWLPGMD